MTFAILAVLYLAAALAMAWGLSVFLASAEAEELMDVIRAMGTSGYVRMGAYLAFCCLCWPAALVWLASQKQIRDTIVNAYREAKAANKADAEAAKKVTGRIDAEFEEGP